MLSEAWADGSPQTLRHSKLMFHGCLHRQGSASTGHVLHYLYFKTWFKVTHYLLQSDIKVHINNLQENHRSCELMSSAF